MRSMVEVITRQFEAPLHVHCHNDFGLALANTLAAAEAGASILDATVNGLGERAGNTCLDELAVALERFYGVQTGIHLEALYGLAHEVSRWTGVPLPAHKPLVGDNAFAHKLEGHVRGVMAAPHLYEPIAPETVGNTRRIPIGKYSGSTAVGYRLRQLGIETSAEDVQAVLAALAARWDGRQTSLSDDEFASIVDTTLKARARR
jgi:isopropylmalate/homocitrate/citramalate synthase